MQLINSFNYTYLSSITGKLVIGIGRKMESELFHVHTYRCKHASEEQDYEYIEKAITLGAKRITFTDHAPFPGNPFGLRMEMDELPEYLNSLTQLKQKYKDHIDVVIGLEIEYLPSFSSYYLELQKLEQLQFLMLGQHFCEYGPECYSFDVKREVLKKEEAIGIGKAMVQGIESGLFKVVAHPDRLFRRRKDWEPDMEQISKNIITAAIENDVFLEQNESSKLRKYQYWKEFWDFADILAKKQEGTGKQLRIIRGLDAHSTKELEVLSGR